jgi:3-hydroxyacyl-CoA dehydrogenase
VAKAVEMCVSGNSISAQDALRLGLVDQLIEGELLAGATAFARKIATKPLSKARERSDKLGNTAENANIFASAKQTVHKKQRGLKAPLAVIEALEAATKLPFGEGCDIEQRLFSECLFFEQSKSLIHVFFGEREVAKIPDVPGDTAPIPINFCCASRIEKWEDVRNERLRSHKKGGEKYEQKRHAR